VCVRAGAVISMGTYIGRSTPIIERSTGEVFYGEVPENAVVIPGGRLGQDGISTYAAIIVKYADGKTRAKTALNQDVRTP
jgi:2,3,4,5-tetrahydropyridine-2-carboxylate N-succinyltransferase/putative acetyltransferase